MASRYVCTCTGTMGGKCVSTGCERMTRGTFGKLGSGLLVRGPSNALALAHYYRMNNLKKRPCQSNDFRCCVNRGVHSGSTGTANPFVVKYVRLKR